MNDEPPPTPVSETEMRQVNFEFDRQHRAFLERIARWRSPRTVAFRDLANRVHQRFDASYRQDRGFRAYVRTNGVAAIRSHAFWAQWIAWEVSDQWYRHYGAMPRMTTYAQNLFLRLAAGRNDGMLFPLVGDRRLPDERRLLNDLIHEKKLWEVPTEEGVGVWREDADLGSLGLRPTDKDSGNGHGRLEELVSRGFFEKFRTDDPRRLWRYEENVAFTLQLTPSGRQYIYDLSSGSNEVTIHRDDEADMDLPDDVPEIEDILEGRAFERWMTPSRLIEILGFAVAAGWMPANHAEAFRLRKMGEAPGDEAWTMQRVADRIGVGTSTIDRWEKKYDDLFASPEMRRILLLRFPRE